MPELPQNPDAEVSGGRERRIRWDALAAVIASLVGLLALLVAGYTAYIERQQVRAQVWPYLQMGKSNARGQYEFVALNKGMGPVIVNSVQVLISGEPVRNWGELERRVGFDSRGSQVTSTLNGLVLAPGDRIRWIAFENEDDVNALMEDWRKFHVQARVCYSSTLGESWRVIYQMGPLPRPRPVSGCKVPDAAQFFD
jgi:hypothetical protein